MFFPGPWYNRGFGKKENREGKQERRQRMQNIPIETKCKIGNQILQILQRNEIAAGSKIDIHIEILKNGAIKKIELTEGEAK